jgi:DNA-binding NarL/FixJ family response regulator
LFVISSRAVSPQKIYQDDVQMKKARVLIADDHDKMRCLIVELLDIDFPVVGAVDNGDDLVKAAARLRPDVIVSDIMMPRMSGLAARDTLIATGRAIPFVFVSGLGKEVASLLPTSCPVAFVHTKDLSSHLCNAVEAVLSGGVYLSPQYQKLT